MGKTVTYALCLLMLLLCGKVGYGQVIRTFAGTGGTGTLTDGVLATSSTTVLPGSGSFDAVGNYYFASTPSRIRKVTPAGIITTVVGAGSAGFSGDGGPATAAQIHCSGIAVDSAGNIFIADYHNFRIRKVDVSTGIITTIAGTGVNSSTGNGGPAIEATMASADVLADNIGNIYLHDNYGGTRKIDTGGIITQVASIAGWLCFHPSGDLLIGGGFWVCRLNLTTGGLDTIAGSGHPFFNGDGIRADTANFRIMDIASDSFGNIYIADHVNSRIRKIDVSGYIHTIAGTGVNGYSGDDGPAVSAQIYRPEGLAVDRCNNLYVGDAANHRVRKIYLNTSTTDTPTLTIAATADSVCAGTAVTYTATMGGGGGSTGYSWRVNGTVISGATAASYTYAPGLYDTVRCMVTTANPCASPAYATSNAIHTVVYPGITPTITITSSPGDTVCAGTTVTYTATTTGGGSIPAYQWRVNGIAISGATANTYSYTPTNGDSIRCLLTSTAPCVTTTTISSNMRYMVVNSPITPTITITSSPGDTVCFGTAVTYTATSTSGGSTPAYQWRVNGTTISGATLSTYSYTPANGDSIRCILTSTAPCITTTTASSNMRYMVVNPPITPTITITSSPGDTVCFGTSVTYTATTTSGGSTPGYQWRVNGTAISGATSSTYSYTPANGDSVQCTLTSSAPCTSTAAVYSNTRHMVVIGSEVPTISIEPSPNDTLCISGAVSFTASITLGGSSPAYQWKVNGINVGTSIPTYSYTAANGDSIRCILTSSAPCAIPPVVSSNTVNMVVDTLNTPTITLSGPSTSAMGATVTITATLTSAGSSYSIHWYNHGIVFATTTIPLVNYTKTLATDSITARIVPDVRCTDSATSLLHIVLHDLGITDAITGTLTVWPNPAGDVLHVACNEVLEAITITNLLGQVVYSIANVGTQQFSLSIANLPSGIYVLRAGNTTLKLNKK